MLEKIKINTKILRELDYVVLITAILIVIYGSLNIYSISGKQQMKLQLIWLVISLVMTYFIIIFDYKIIANYAGVFYWASIILLILNDTVLGQTVNGATGWIKLGPVSIQPAEFAKLGMIIMLAKKLEDMDGKINEPKNFFTLLFYAVIPMFLIVIQPDMGMTMVCFFIVLGIFYIAGLNEKVIFGGIGGIVLFLTIVWNSPFMPTYWKGRLMAFLTPGKFESSYGHQTMQSLIGIGSGGAFGKGFLKGKQSKLVPEAFTDFIFSVLGEEWGLIGAIILLILYGILIYRLVKIAQTSKDIFGSVICIGVISTLLFSILQNIGMTISIMPVTGITLPLMSYGGSSLLTNFMALALTLNIGMRRKKINF